MAASKTRNLRPSGLELTCSTWATRTPALAAIIRPGSNANWMRQGPPITARNHGGVARRRGRRRLVEVGHAKAAAEIQPLDAEAFAAQLDQPAHLHEGGLQRGEIGDLAADMAGDADRANASHVRSVGVKSLRLSHRHAKLVLGLARRDFCVTAGFNVGIDPNGDARALAHRLADRIDQMQLRLGLQVDLGDAHLRGRRRFRPLVLPTPEKTMRSGATPAAIALRISPSETTSAPAPALARVRKHRVMLELAFTAKHAINGSFSPAPTNASRSTRKCRSSVADE